MATADLTVIALGRSATSASDYIAEIQRRLARQDKVRYQLHAMGTSLEGKTEDSGRRVQEVHNVGRPRPHPRLPTKCMTVMHNVGRPSTAPGRPTKCVQRLVRGPGRCERERARGIEPPFLAWEASVLAIGQRPRGSLEITGSRVP